MEEESERRSGDDSRRDGLIDIPQGSREPITGKQERDLEYNEEGFHRDVDMPHRHPGHPPMSTPTSLCQRPAHLDLIVSGHCFSSTAKQAARTDTVRLAYIVH